ncbi:uncharacterized SAM-binding protein YcdF (DUF218 family) [Alkalihalobacillus xiaoxiensis]|uniref:Uncharacterized SAM-binding protein YcdF (DUF218 family) n=1 Tax=Shouchella xiaoxiensis TaxID=766895 RepID=A0ABS2SW20_9BACI|nr:YdcF family protein [Shouchella xiaoxiensis]MBM7839707.1 uncharacterized SAM-binding protein YcdF (DUF218 family) [Shouchella xiaoxiensis]
MYLSTLRIEDLTDAQLTKLLFHVGEDDQKQADCIFVPGSSKAVDYKVPKAASLYKAGRAKTLLFSGGVSWDESKKPEAELMQERAVQLGIPAEAILTETDSLHTKENVLASLLVLDRAFDLHKMERVIIVTSSIHTRRVLLTMKTYMPDWINYSLAPVDDRTTKATNWFASPFSRKRVLTEATKLVEYTRTGAIIDQDLGDLLNT